MQLLATLLLLPTLIAALPGPAATPTDISYICTGGSYESCVNSKFCTQSWPESCECRNAQIDRCMKACHVTFIVDPHQNCSKPLETSKRGSPDCYQTCISGKICVQSWPQSCICKNKQSKECGDKCGVLVKLRDCGQVQRLG
jgi:hypothetical protein